MPHPERSFEELLAEVESVYGEIPDVSHELLEDEDGGIPMGFVLLPQGLRR